MIGPFETGLKLHAPSNTGFGGNRTRHESIANHEGHHAVTSIGHEHYPYPKSHESGTVEKRLTFAYGRTLVTSRMIVFVSLAILAAILIVFTSSPISAILGLTGLLAAYLVLFAISPLLTQHWITRSRVILRQGWYFRAMIPFSSIDLLVAADDAGAVHSARRSESAVRSASPSCS